MVRMQSSNKNRKDKEILHIHHTVQKYSREKQIQKHLWLIQANEFPTGEGDVPLEEERNEKIRRFQIETTRNANYQEKKEKKQETRTNQERGRDDDDHHMKNEPMLWEWG